MHKRISIFLAGFFLFAASVSVFYFMVLRQQFETVIEGRIYRSSQPGIDELEMWIRKKGLKTVINLRGKKDDEKWFVSERNIAAKHGIALYSFRLSPHELPGYLDLTEILKVLMKAERPVLVHCRHGVDRTGLVSALALAIEKDPPLGELKEQFSWRYGLLPLYTSAGPLFFSLYEQWLEKTGTSHNLATFLSWERKEYVDGQGNMEYSIGSVNNKLFESKTLYLQDSSEIVAIEGWAFDSKELAPPDKIIVTLSNHVAQGVSVFADRPDVADYFGLTPSSGSFPAGWRVTFGASELPEGTSGCHTISLTVLRTSKAPLTIQTESKFCINRLT